jgi:exodeoxyribonuclease V gamma subunit
MLRVVYSNRTEELIRELASRVRAQQAVVTALAGRATALAGQAGGPLVPVPVVVPGAAMESAVRLGIAREVGIAANLDVQLLTRFAAKVVSSSLAGEAVRVADAGAMEAMVLELLLGDLAGDALAPLTTYLRSAGDDPDAVDGRRAQLAARIGRIFEEYTYSRGEMLTGWLKDERQLDPRHAETEAWQSRLWRLLFGPSGVASRRTPSGKT